MWCSVEGLEQYSKEGRAGEGHSLHTPLRILHTQHCNLHTPHCTLHTAQTPQTPNSTLHKLHTPHSTLHTPHSTLQEEGASGGVREGRAVWNSGDSHRSQEEYHTPGCQVRERLSLVLPAPCLRSSVCSLFPALCLMASWHICFMASWHLSRHLGILPSVLLTSHLPRDTEIAKIPAGLINSIKLKYPMVVSR